MDLVIYMSATVWIMPKPAFFVDGHMEALIFEKMGCDYTIRRTNLNGKTVSVEALVKKIDFLYRLLNNRHYPVFVIVDKEQRNVSAAEYKSEIINELKKQGLPTDQFKIGVCDSMIENWILADTDQLIEKLGKIKKACYDGTHGKNILKKMFPVEKPYQETTDGVSLFINARPSKMIENSPSFKSFFDVFEGDCWWMYR